MCDCARPTSDIYVILFLRRVAWAVVSAIAGGKIPVASPHAVKVLSIRQCRHERPVHGAVREVAVLEVAGRLRMIPEGEVAVRLSNDSCPAFVFAIQQLCNLGLLSFLQVFNVRASTGRPRLRKCKQRPVLVGVRRHVV